MEDLLHANIQSVLTQVRERNWDWIVLLDGPERVGKSLLATQILLDTEDFSSNPMRALNHLAWDFITYEKRLRDLPRGSCIVYHEAGLLGRESNSKMNRRMVKIFTASGARNMLTVLTYPSFRLVDPYLRNHRIRTRGYVHTRNGERGYVKWFVKSQTPWESDGDTPFLETFSSRFYPFEDIYVPLWAAIEELDRSVKDAMLLHS